MLRVIAVFISFCPWRAAVAAAAAVDFLLLLLRAPPTRPLLGGGKHQKKMALAVGHFCVCVGVMEVAVQCKNCMSEV